MNQRRERVDQRRKKIERKNESGISKTKNLRNLKKSMIFMDGILGISSEAIDSGGV